MIRRNGGTTRQRLVTLTPEARTLASRGRIGFNFSEVFWGSGSLSLSWGNGKSLEHRDLEKSVSIPDTIMCRV